MRVYKPATLWALFLASAVAVVEASNSGEATDTDAMMIMMTSPRLRSNGNNNNNNIEEKERQLGSGMMRKEMRAREGKKKRKSQSQKRKSQKSSKSFFYSASIEDPSNPGVCDETTVCGTVAFSEPTEFKSDLTLVTYKITGLTPGLHGLHIHENPVETDCLSTLGHWNPKNQNHGSNLDAQRHLGDLGNILADDSGIATGELLANVPLDGGLDKLAVVVHAGTDDLGLGGDAGSRAVGNAGSRPGCGNIVLMYEM